MADDPIKDARAVRQPVKYKWDDAIFDITVPRLDQNGLEIDQELMQIRMSRDPADNPDQPPTPFIANVDRLAAITVLRMIARRLGRIT